MSIPTNEQAYAKLKELVEAIDDRDSQALLNDFGISSAVAEEIFESIDEYFPEGAKLSIAPEKTAFDSRKPRPFIDAYETDDKGLGLECILFANGEPGEAILHAEVAASDGKLSLSYKYIGS
ncbi:hypothetical protein [Pseudomonas fluorescens]|uniref:Uncharacterized protein n=1 Tax=Pseudomonas fluorescens TaxID=294 RepID=A0A423LN45_PSEFL|nr:hypothetical protein [Pseudomonas fluorescens]RON69739.1 hypothetical protein BK671_10040 [Pseudomonas fluorescens]